MVALLGFFVSFLVSVWPTDYLFFLNLYYGMKSSDFWIFIQILLFYILGFSVFFILLFLFMIFRYSLKAQGKIHGTAFQSILASAIFISIGLGLIQITIQSLFN